ncbi:hypothetical protein EVAR_11243_1 [Eumeta japonica]|uniref:BESS domain-containing protein n=1 Tax=Eumeta variegata TaxID=151549 RepID=A0A4C1ULG5_EUMVA|nr:hypothetical protein EVAR_11243_1 [Eumeta japonica]
MHNLAEDYLLTTVGKYVGVGSVIALLCHATTTGGRMFREITEINSIRNGGRLRSAVKFCIMIRINQDNPKMLRKRACGLGSGQTSDKPARRARGNIKRIRCLCVFTSNKRRSARFTRDVRLNEGNLDEPTDGNSNDNERSPTPQSIAGSSTSTQYTSTKRKQAQDLRQEFMELEKKKLDLLQIKLSQSTERQEPDCEDLLFFKSLLPYMKELASMQKLRTRNKITDVIMNEMNAGTTQAYHGYNTYEYNTSNYGN